MLKAMPGMYLNDVMDVMQLSAGYSYTLGGEIETRQDSFGGFGMIRVRRSYRA